MLVIINAVCLITYSLLYLNEFRRAYNRLANLPYTRFRMGNLVLRLQAREGWGGEAAKGEGWRARLTQVSSRHLGQAGTWVQGRLGPLPAGERSRGEREATAWRRGWHCVGGGRWRAGAGGRRQRLTCGAHAQAATITAGPPSCAAPLLSSSPQARLRVLSIVFFVFSAIIYTFVELNTCASYITSWLGYLVGGEGLACEC